MNRMTRLRLITALCIGGITCLTAITGLTIKYNPGGEMMILGVVIGAGMYCLVDIMNLAMNEIVESRKREPIDDPSLAFAQYLFDKDD